MTKRRGLSVAGMAAMTVALALMAMVQGDRLKTAFAGPETVVVWNGTLIDGTGATPIRNGAVVIEDGVIVDVGRAGQVTIPANAHKVDAHSGTIMPGVIDPHTHIGDSLWQQQDILSPWLQTGVTTVQDLGTLWFLVPLYRERVAALEQPPRVQFAGPIISPRGGYPNDEWSDDYGVDTVEEARAFVKKLIEETGVDVIKIAIERGYSIDYDEEGLPVLTAEQVAAITEEAHARGRIVIAHVTDPMELEIAVDNGVDVLAHAPVSATSDSVLRHAIARDVPMITTIGAWGDRENRPYYALKNAVRYWQLGGRIITATDYPFQSPSMPLREFRLLSDGGIPNMDLIVAATKNAAAALGRDDLGTLEVGKIGDVIVVAGDPLENIQAMANVEAVVLEGRVVKGGVEGATPTAMPPVFPHAVTTPVQASPAPTAAVALPPVGDSSTHHGLQLTAETIALLVAGLSLAAAGALRLRFQRR